MAILFHQDNRSSRRQKRIFALYEIARTSVDFGAASCFVVGSIFFFWSTTETVALWLFLVGSILFAVKPTLKLSREIHLARIGDAADLAHRYEG
ncbi:YrhK-like protein [Loktanella atrilutea]|uniref:YrhK-like protein n=1 Tax=Loktanella atrilutea TaxID=366533 RepID=A0A1M4YUJ7_LOKAT|nr:YrhK family protein [Loktanella atrilutea]SHF09431.1 YrhK-like protein [Loktanella atrilutea]